MGRTVWLLLVAFVLAGHVANGLRRRTNDCNCWCPCSPYLYCDCYGKCTKTPGPHDYTTTPVTTRTTTTPTTTTTTPTTTTTTPTTTTTTPTTTTTTPTTTTTTPTTTTTTPTTTTTTPTTTTTTPTTPGPFTSCDRRMDIAVVIDHSRFIRFANFAKAKKLIVDALNLFTNIRPGGTHIAYYTFGRTPFRYSYLSQYKIWVDKRSRILRSRYRGNIPQIVRMLKVLYQRVFTSRRGMRPRGRGYGSGNNAAKLTVIMTNRAIIRDRPEIMLWSTNLKRKSKVIVVGLGDTLSHFLLHRLPSKPTYIFGLMPSTGPAYATPIRLAEAMCGI